LHVAVELGVEKEAEVLVRVDYFECGGTERDNWLKVIALVWREVHQLAFVHIQLHHVIVTPALDGVDSVLG
jgi:hypothetical protein